MKAFKNLSIKGKLIRIQLVTTSTVLILCVLGFYVYNMKSLKRTTTANLLSTARVIAINSVATLTFQDADAGAEVLSALRAERNIVGGCLLDAEGALFATYGKFDHHLPSLIEEMQAFGAKPEEELVHFGTVYVDVFHKITQDSGHLGILYLRLDRSVFEEAMNQIALIAGIVLLLGIALSIILAGLLQKSISGPILNLVKATKDVSITRDYSIRVDVLGNDELGVLYGEFNEMLTQIQERDMALQEARGELEERVKERTKELENEITERKHAEQEVRESRALFQDIALSTSDWLWEVNAEGVYTFCSEKVEQVLGYTPQEIIGKTPFDLMPPDEAEKIGRQFQGIVGRKAPIVDLKNWNIHKDGHEVCLLTNGVPMLDVKGNLVGYRGADKDITDRERAEKEKEQLEARLRQGQKMEAIGTLAGGIAHDFNNILMAILGCTDMAMLDVPKGSVTRANLEHVIQAGMRAKDLVLQILAFSRQAEQERKPGQLHPVVKEALHLLRSSLPTTIEIRQDIDTNSGTVLADPTQIHQVLMNLCTNAYHAMREEGGILEVKLDAVEVDAESARTHPDLREEAYVRLIISDTGHGMDRATMERAFDPFFTTKGPGEGTGMGLATVHGIVTSHGGAITLYSELGNGSTFQIYLPRVESATPVEILDIEPVTRGKESILFVDDEVSLVHIGKQMLERLGYNVTARTSSVEALELFRAKPDRFDLVITDQTMPNMTGVELAEELMRIQPDIPIILVTGFSEVVTPERAKQIGFREYIMKPILTRDLNKAIRRVLDQEEEKELE